MSSDFEGDFADFADDGAGEAGESGESSWFYDPEWVEFADGFVRALQSDPKLIETWYADYAKENELRGLIEAAAEQATAEQAAGGPASGEKSTGWPASSISSRPIESAGVARAAREHMKQHNAQLAARRR